ncbi:hypothetical protein D3C72_2525670 [compost metagenome]
MVALESGAVVVYEPVPSVVESCSPLTVTSFSTVGAVWLCVLACCAWARLVQTISTAAARGVR